MPEQVHGPHHPHEDPNDPSGRSTDDDQAWLDLLAGRDTPGARADTRDEAVWLRRAITTGDSPRIAGDPQDEAQRIEHLLGRARAAGVLSRREERITRFGLPWTGWLRGASMALTALCIVVVGWFVQRPDLEESAVDTVPVQRSTGAVQRLTAVEPVRLRDAIVAVLRGAQADVHTYEQLGRLGIDAELPATATPAELALLLSLGVKAEPGPLRIEIEAAR